MQHEMQAGVTQWFMWLGLCKDFFVSVLRSVYIGCSSGQTLNKDQGQQGGCSKSPCKVR